MEPGRNDFYRQEKCKDEWPRWTSPHHSLSGRGVVKTGLTALSASVLKILPPLPTLYIWCSTVQERGRASTTGTGWFLLSVIPTNNFSLGRDNSRLYQHWQLFSHPNPGYNVRTMYPGYGPCWAVQRIIPTSVVPFLISQVSWGTEDIKTSRR